MSRRFWSSGVCNNDMKNRFAAAVITMCLLVLFDTGYGNSITLAYHDARQPDTSIELHNTEHGRYLPLEELVGFLGCSASFDATRHMLLCESSAGEEYRFAAGVHFCSGGGRTVQLLYAPIMHNGSIYYPVSDITSFVSNVFPGYRAEYNAEKGNILFTTRAETSTPGGIEARAGHDTVTIAIPSVQSVVIDPGHGGRDPGALGGGGLMEKDVVLGIALHLRDLIQEKTDMKVYMTRDDDTFIPLRKRTDFANRKKADLFLSIHANAIGGSEKKRRNVRGYKMYFLSEAKNETDKRVAMRENAVVEFEKKTDRGDYLQNILLDLTSNEYLEESQRMAICLEGSFHQKLKKVRKLHRGVGQANFWVLNGALMPAVLVETAFISNPDEEKLLADEAFQKEIARSIFDAVCSFKQKYEQ